MKKNVMIKPKLKFKKYSELKKDFTKIDNNVFLIKDGGAISVYIYLCKNFNENYGYAFPTIKNMSENLNMSEKTIKNKIKLLKEKNFIKVGKNPNSQGYKNNIYYIYYVDEIIEEVVEVEEEFTVDADNVVDKLEDLNNFKSN